MGGGGGRGYGGGGQRTYTNAGPPGAPGSGPPGSFGGAAGAPRSPSGGFGERRGPGGGGPSSGPPGSRFGPNAPRGGGGGGRGRGRGRDSDRDSDSRRGGPRQSAAEKVEARRSARAARKTARAARSETAVAEDIFEVPVAGMPLSELAERMAVPPGAVVKALFMRGLMVQVNQVLDAEMVVGVAAEFGCEAVVEDEAGVAEASRKSGDFGGRLSAEDVGELALPRPPVVTVMGHVDHGKTSLLDYVRKARVAAGEAGGITQGIGAYTCDLEMRGDGDDEGGPPPPASSGADADGDGGAPAVASTTRRITFLDTPGHEAFSAMRARGTRVTDIAIIVVAADDGVRPQTLEAIAHARAAGVPIIVALNKMDKEGASPDRVKQELADAGVVAEEWGGDVPVCPISAKKGDGVDALLETVCLVAELEELSANPDRPAVGTVLEASLDRRTGPTANVLVAAGTLRPGDVVVSGGAYGRVRSLLDGAGADVEAAGPSIAVTLVGLTAVPAAGEPFEVCETEQEARKKAEAAEAAARLARLQDAAATTRVTTMSLASMSLDDDDFGGGVLAAEGAFASGAGGGWSSASGGAGGNGVDGDVEALQRINVVLKADAAGAVEAIKAAAASLPQDRVTLRFLLAAAADITLSDVDLAFASDALILGFNIEPSDAVAASAKRSAVTIKSYRVIYDVLDDLRAAMEGRLATVDERLPLGEAAVRAVFGSGSRRVAGCALTEGVLRKGALAVVKRGKAGKQVVVAEGKITSLRRVKEDVKEVSGLGTECGVGVEGFAEWAEGDSIEAFELKAKQRTLEEASKEVADLGATLATAASVAAAAAADAGAEPARAKR